MHSEDFVILVCTVLAQYSSVTDRRTWTDGQTDARAIAMTREAFCISRVKNGVEDRESETRGAENRS